MKKTGTKQMLFEMMEKVNPEFKKKLFEESQLQLYSEPAEHLSDFEERAYNLIEKMYPNIQYMMIVEKFIPNKGWINCNCTLTEENIDKLIQEGVTRINLKIIDESGDTFYPDYSISEFGKETSDNKRIEINEVGIASDVVNASKTMTPTQQRANAHINNPQEFQDGFMAWLGTTGFDPVKKPLSIGDAQTRVKNAMIALGYK